MSQNNKACNLIISLLNLNLYQNMFFHKTWSELSNHSMEPGQTLFQYLKRKKHIELKQSIENTFRSQSLISKEPPNKQQLQINKKPADVKQQARQASTKRRGKKSSSKKKKTNKNFDSQKQNYSELSNLRQNIFKDQKITRRSLADTGVQMIFQEKPEPITRKIPTRSFVSMISPLKNQTSLQHSPYSRPQSFSKIHQTKSTKKVAEFTSKKVIKEAISKIRQYCNQQIDFQKEIKYKIKDFFILLNSLLYQFDESGEKFISNAIDKKIKELRSSMKLINAYALRRQGKEKEDICQLIEQIYVSFNQVFDRFEGQVKSESQSNCQTIILKKQQEFEQKIEELTKQKNGLNREINSLNKEYNRLEKQYNQLLQKYNFLEDQNVQKAKQIQKQENQRFQRLENEVESLTQENFALKNKIYLLQKKLKDSEYKFQENSRRVHIEHQEKLTERQNYLLNEISLLKAECSKDIKNLNNFYLNRQEQYPKKIQELQNIISTHLLTIEKLDQALKTTQKVTKIQESNVKDSKRKVEQVMADLYRINEQLYKHWLALKDIKTLLCRLNMFDKFERIFRDIPFDEVLFLP